MTRPLATGLLAALLLLTACAATAATGDAERRPRAVSSIDLERYMGRWYEVARYPNSYQKGTVGVIAHYRLKSNGRIVLENTARKKSLEGKEKSGSGRGVVVKGSGGAKWDVTFIRPFTADYWIIELDPEYRWAVVGQPSRKNLWILSRTPALEESVEKTIREKLETHGYDPARLESTPQPKDAPAFTPGADGRA
ncbi:MAG: lipocalin family protein [Planctomycetota bacterium]|jgi:apolipoprotein D and lipocalin family protein